MTQTSPKKNKDYSANQAISTNLDNSNSIQIDSRRNQSGLAQWWGKKNLQFKTSLLAVLIGIVPVITVGLMASLVVVNPLKTQIENREKDQVEAILTKVQLLLTDRYKDIQAMAILDVFTNTGNTATRGQKDAILNEFIEIYQLYDSIAVFDIAGNVVAQSKGTKLNNHLNRTYIQDALKKNGPVISDPLISTTEGTFNIYVADVIKDIATGKSLGFIRARIPVKTLQDIIKSTNEQEKQSYYLVDSTGNIFLSNEKIYLKQINSAGQEVQEKEGENQLKAPTINEVFPKIENLTDSEGIKSIISQNILEKQEQILAYGRMATNDLDKKYSAIVAIDKRLLSEAQNEVLRIIFVGTLLTGGIVFIIGIELSKRFTSPIVSAARNIEKISSGDLDVYIEIEGNDEIATLGKDINIMIKQIKSLVKEQQTFALQSTLLKNITIKLSEALDEATIFAISVREIREALQTDRVIIYQFDDDWQGTIVAESVDSKFPKTLGAQILDPCFADKYVEKYMEGRVHSTPDIYKAGLTDCHLRQLETFEVKANLVAPILIEGELIGLLISHQCVSSREWESSEIEFFSQMATQIGPSLERTNLLENQKLDSFLAQALKEVSFKIAECLNQETIFEVAINETRKTIKGDRVIIYSFDENYKGTIVAESVDPAYPKSLGAEILDPCFADQYVEKYQQGRVQATNNIYTAGLTKCHLTQLEPFEIKANLVTPIIVEGELLGLFIVHQCSAPRKWLEAECNFVSQVGTQIGPSLERINLLAKQQDREMEQREARERMQQRALELLMQVDPVSQGDLTIRAEVTEDEIGTIADSYNATIESLRKIVTQVQIASSEVTRVTTDQESFIGSLATESIRQSEDIGQALDQIQSLAYSARMVLNNAEQAEEAVKQSNRSVEEGEIAMNRTVDGILAIRETVAETAKKVKRLGESTQKISKVVNLISSFADQTNLLALNASIEAAHAGEEGRGFAVVAEEVRSLARQSADATAEIEKVVAEIQEETNDVVKAMESGTEQVVEGTRMVEETRASLSEITAASAQINELVTAIAAAAAEQSQTSEEITEKMADVASISNETSVAITQVSESFQQLLQVAEELSFTVSKFKV